VGRGRKGQRVWSRSRREGETGFRGICSLNLVEAHAIVVAHLAFPTECRDVGEIDARHGDEGAAVVPLRHGDPPCARAKSPERDKNLHQFLPAIGVKALRTHLGQLLGIAQVSRDSDEYERQVKRIFGEQMELDVERDLSHLLAAPPR
jgi:hypothetical protein